MAVSGFWVWLGCSSVSHLGLPQRCPHGDRASEAIKGRTPVTAPARLWGGQAMCVVDIALEPHLVPLGVRVSFCLHLTSAPCWQDSKVESHLPDFQV